MIQSTAQKDMYALLLDYQDDFLVVRDAMNCDKSIGLSNMHITQKSIGRLKYIKRTESEKVTSFYINDDNKTKIVINPEENENMALVNIFERSTTLIDALSNDIITGFVCHELGHWIDEENLLQEEIAKKIQAVSYKYGNKFQMNIKQLRADLIACEYGFRDLLLDSFKFHIDNYLPCYNMNYCSELSKRFIIIKNLIK